MSETKKSNYLTGAAILAATVAITKILGFVYTVTVFNLLGDEGVTHFDVAYNIYNLLLTISTAGIPVAISRLISESAALGKRDQLRRYYSVSKTAFNLIGVVGAALMFVLAQWFSNWMNDSDAVYGIRVLAPAVYFSCIVSVYRGYTQGFSEMAPTALSQIMESLFKLIVGLAAVYIVYKRGGSSGMMSAAAIVGVTVGLGLAVPVMMVEKGKVDRRRRHFFTQINHKVMGKRTTLRQVMMITIPIALSSSLLNIIMVINTKLILERLQSTAAVAAGYTALYGVYAKGVKISTLPSAFIVPITTSIVPAIAEAFAVKKYQDAKAVMESALKVTNLIALPAAVGMSVLAYPIFQVIYPNSNTSGPMLLAMLGVGSYFISAYLTTGAILQATGHEKLAMLTFPIGGIVNIAVNWVLIGNPSVNIYGAPIGMFACYGLITLLNMIFIKTRLKTPPAYLKTFLRPALCSALMGAAAYAVYFLLHRVGLRMLFALFAAIVVAVVVYAFLVVVLRAVTKEDMALVPKGEKIAKVLKIRD